MIDKDTATQIALSYREIETAEALLAEVRQAMDKSEPRDLRDVFGRPQRGLQLGVPSGENGHRLYDVPYALAVPVIEAHVAHHRTRISVLCQKAASEMATGASAWHWLVRSAVRRVPCGRSAW